MNGIDAERRSHRLWSALHLYEDVFGPGSIADAREGWSHGDPEYQILCNAVYILGPVSTSLLLELYSYHPKEFLRVACGDSTVNLPKGFEAWGLEKGKVNKHE